MRISVDLETGNESKYVVFQSEILEKLTKFTVEEAYSQFHTLGSDGLVDEMVDLLPTYLNCQAREVETGNYIHYHQKGIDGETMDVLSEVETIYVIDEVIETRHSSL